MAQRLAVLGLLAVLVWLSAKALIGVGRYLGALDSDLSRALVAAAATALASVIALVGSKAYEAKLAVRQELRARKTPIYERIIQTLYRVVFAGVLSQPQLSEKELKTFFAATTEQLTVWGSDYLLRAWGEWKKQAGTQDSPEQALFLVEDLLFAIRKDLGHRNRGLGRGSLLRLFVTDFDDHLKRPESGGGKTSR